MALSEELSREGSRKSTGSSQPKQAFPWESAFVLKRSPSLEESVDSAKTKGEDWKGPFGELREKLAALKKREDIVSSNDVQLRASLERTFSSMAREIQRLNEELRYIKTVLSEVQEQPRFGQVSTSTGISTPQLEEIMTEVCAAMDRQHYVTQADLRKTQLSLPPDIIPRLPHVEGEMFNDAGLVSQLSERVENLEAARATKAVDIGGFIFTDEAATDTWTRSLADKELHRLVPDFLSYFLLADPKFDMVKGGLDQMAAVAKAQYSSLDLATIVLSFSMTYPPNMMTKSEKVEAQVTDRIAWATPFATHEVFEGDYSNGTHKKVKKSLEAAAKSVDAGIYFSFPASTHPKANAVLKAQSTLAVAQCVNFLTLSPPFTRRLKGVACLLKILGSVA